MTQWYYADAQRERQGPIDTDTLVARLSQGIIDRSSLVWREGLPQWVALREVAAELGVDTPVPAPPSRPDIHQWTFPAVNRRRRFTRPAPRWITRPPQWRRLPAPL